MPGKAKNPRFKGKPVPDPKQPHDFDAGAKADGKNDAQRKLGGK